MYMAEYSKLDAFKREPLRQTVEVSSPQQWDGVQRLCVDLVWTAVITCLEGNQESYDWLLVEHEGLMSRSPVPFELAASAVGFNVGRVRDFVTHWLPKLEEMTYFERRRFVRKLIENLKQQEVYGGQLH